MIYIPYFLLLSLLGLIIMANSGNANINRVLTYVGMYIVLPLGLIPLQSSIPINFLGLNLQIINQDSVGYYFTIAFSLTLVCGALYCVSFNNVNYKEIGLAFIFSGLAITVVSSNDLIIIAILLQILPIIAAIMVAINNSIKSKRAAIQLLVVNSLGALLFSIGAEAYINITGSTTITNLAPLNHYSSYLMLAGLLILIATPPLSNWLIEELSVASAKSSIFLSIFTPKIALVLVIKMFSGEVTLLYVGIILTFYGLIFSLFTPNFRKILAYAIVHQIGFVLIVLSIAPKAQHDGLNTFIFTHILYELCFFIIAAICNNYFKHDDIYKMQGFFHYRPVIGIMLLIASLNSLGFPFTSGFIGKILISGIMEASGSVFIYYFTFFSAAAYALHIGFKIFYVLYLKAPAKQNIERFKNLDIGFIQFLPVAFILLITIVHYLVYSYLYPNINNIENIYHEIRVAIIGIIMFAFLVKFTNHEREHAIYEINHTIITYANNSLFFMVNKVKSFYTIFFTNTDIMLAKTLRSALIIPKIYYNSRVILFMLFSTIILGAILLVL